MNNKGFTLVELLMTIAILGLLIGIAVPSYIGISNTVRKSQRKNIVSKIEMAASKYAYDTGETIIFVDKLVTEGYIDSDDEEGNIKDPANQLRMNCYIVEMQKNGDYYNAKFIDGKNYDKNGVCDLSKLKENSQEVAIQVSSNGNIVSDTNAWIKGNASLTAYSNNTIVIDCENNKCEWFSSSGASVTGASQISSLSISGILETKYTFQYTIYNEDTSKITRYKASVNLKVDNDVPYIYDEQIKVTDRFINTASKNVTLIASDGEGSGILGYYLGKTTNSCDNVSLNYQSSNVFTVNEAGEYKICVKDKAGNVSSSSITINYIL